MNAIILILLQFNFCVPFDVKDEKIEKKSDNFFSLFDWFFLDDYEDYYDSDDDSSSCDKKTTTTTKKPRKKTTKKPKKITTPRYKKTKPTKAIKQTTERPIISTSTSTISTTTTTLKPKIVTTIKSIDETSTTKNFTTTTVRSAEENTKYSSTTPNIEKSTFTPEVTTRTSGETTRKPKNGDEKYSTTQRILNNDDTNLTNYDYYYYYDDDNVNYTDNNGNLKLGRNDVYEINNLKRNEKTNVKRHKREFDESMIPEISDESFDEELILPILYESHDPIMKHKPIDDAEWIDVEKIMQIAKDINKVSTTENQYDIEELHLSGDDKKFDTKWMKYQVEDNNTDLNDTINPTDQVSSQDSNFIMDLATIGMFTLGFMILFGLIYSLCKPFFKRKSTEKDLVKIPVLINQRPGISNESMTTIELSVPEENSIQSTKPSNLFSTFGKNN